MPLIGLTAYAEEIAEGPWRERCAYLQETYVQGVLAAGGVPVLLPPQPASPEAVTRVLDAVDGLVLTGGPDVDPALYGQDRAPRTDEPRPERDGWERALALAAIERGLPVLAICRGVQLLNAVLGGTLLQHVPDVTDADHGRAPARYAEVPVDVVAGSRLERLLGAERLTVRCHHHQALDRVADRLVVAARSADGIVEAVEGTGSGFLVGVQWHPEQDAADRRLFAALAAAG